ncbi:MAG: CBS domain-containing protein [Vallitaleaceae bacterium]|jgi:acetoin utilization protein AcuB|nr:CBS domain-containing protein [Vallitaleaceae bacterium]
MHVKSLMIPFEELQVLRTTDTVEEALRHIESANLLSLPVVDQHNVFVGVLSKRYIFEDFYKGDNYDKASFNKRLVQTFMRTKLPVTEENIYIEEAALFLFENRMQFLPIVDEHNHKLKGIIPNNALLKKYKDIFGIKHPRLVIYVYDFKGKMAQIINIVNKNGGNIRNIVQVDTEVMGLTEITLRVECKDLDKLVRHLEQHSFEVREISE